LWGSWTGTRKGNQRSEVNFLYSPLFKVLLVVAGLFVLLFTCGGCAGAKHLKIQVPALLDLDVEYFDEKGKNQTTHLKGIFQESQD